MGGIFIYKRAIFIKHLKAFGQNFVFTKRFMCSHACLQPCVPCHSTLLALQLVVQQCKFHQKLQKKQKSRNILN